jgi:pectinesterase
MPLRPATVLAALALLCAAGTAVSAGAAPGAAAAETVTWKSAQSQAAPWYASPEAARIAETVLLAQHTNGGWDKNTDWAKPLTDDVRRALDKERGAVATIDNGATTTEMRFLAKVATGTTDAALRDRCRAAFLRGFDWLLAAQYDNGGWPQFYPLRKGYYTHITFNDDAMARVLELLRDVSRGAEPLGFVDAGRRAKAGRAVAKGIDCVLRCQIRIGGVPTVWCAQHDEKTFAPAPARIYEKASFSGMESVGIVRFLMGEPDPSPAVRAAVEGAVAWLRANRLPGIRVEDRRDSAGEKDRAVVADPSGPGLWARFYELGTRRPIFSGRDGVVKYALADIERERRAGYAWYTDKPAALLEKDYPAWKARLGTRTAGAVEREVVVAADGSGQYAGVQAAIDALPAAERGRVVLRLKPGVYKGPVVFPPSAPPITLRGESAETTVLTGDRYAAQPGPDGKPIGTSATANVLIASDNFRAENVTFENSAGKGRGQAVAVKVTGDRAVFRNCLFIGWQDTLYVNNGRAYFADCLIEGNVDFIFGSAAAVFERCEVRSLGVGYVTAQSRTMPDQLSGFVFRNCDLTAAPDVPAGSVYLGRPWRPLARVVFLDCRLGAHVRAEGWHNWGKTENEATAFFAERGSTGPGATPETTRVPWSHRLTADEAAAFDTRRFLAGLDAWDPTAGASSPGER